MNLNICLSSKCRHSQVKGNWKSWPRCFLVLIPLCCASSCWGQLRQSYSKVDADEDIAGWPNEPRGDDKVLKVFVWQDPVIVIAFYISADGSIVLLIVVNSNDWLSVSVRRLWMPCSNRAQWPEHDRSENPYHFWCFTKRKDQLGTIWGSTSLCITRWMRRSNSIMCSKRRKWTFQSILNFWTCISASFCIWMERWSHIEVSHS